jgi:hypothetical protein
MLDHAVRDQAATLADLAMQQVGELVAYDILQSLCIPELCGQLDPLSTIATGVKVLQFCGALPLPGLCPRNQYWRGHRGYVRAGLVRGGEASHWALSQPLAEPMCTRNGCHQAIVI